MLTSASLQIETINSLVTIEGADVVIKSFDDEFYARMIDPVLINYASSIKSTAYISKPTVDASSDNKKVKLSELSRIDDENAGTFAVNPTSLIDDGLMIAYHDRDTALGVSEQLYTARGS